MVFSGFEIGIALPYPATSIERDYGYVPHHPLAEAYIHRNPAAAQPADLGPDQRALSACSAIAATSTSPRAAG